MSHTTQRPRPAADHSSLGLPTWASLLIVFAALAFGLLMSVFNSTIGAPFIMAFVIGGIVVALFTEARGLFITVASLPIIFAIMTVVTAWWIARSGSPNQGAFSLTTIASTVFPPLQFFPPLFLVTAGATAIAILRLWILRRGASTIERRGDATRRSTARAEARNRDDVRRWRDTQHQESARRWDWPEEEPTRRTRPPRRWEYNDKYTRQDDSQSITVEELIRRNREQRPRRHY